MFRLVTVLMSASIVFLCLITDACPASYGTTSAEFLTIVPDPKSISTGEGNSALADSPGMVVNNPAGISAINQTTLSVSYVPLIEDIRYHFAGIGIPSRLGVFGGSVIYLDYGDIKGYNSQMKEYSLSTSRDTAFLFTYALPLKVYIPYQNDYGSLGVTVKTVHSELAGYSAGTSAADAGAIIPVPYVKGLRAGIVYKNLGSGMKYDNEENNLLQILSYGLGYRNESLRNLAVNLDAECPASGPAVYSAGVSVSPIYFVTLRCGWKESKDTLDTGPRAGIGLNFGDFSLNYAFVPFKEYSAQHRLGAEVLLGNILSPNRVSDHYLQLHFRQAKLYVSQNDHVAAQAELEQITSIYPDYAPAREYLAKVNKIIRDENVRKIGRAAEYVKKAKVLLDRNDFMDAKKYYSNALRYDPYNEEAKSGIEKVEQRLEERKAEETKKANEDKIVDAWRGAIDAFEKGDYVVSKERFTKLLSLDPKHEEAIKYVMEIDNRLAKVTANQVNDLFTKAVGFYKDESFEKALKYFEAVVIAAPHRGDAKEYIGRCQDAILQREEKLKTERLAKEQKAVKDEIEALYRSALKHYESGDYVQALELFDRTDAIAKQYQFSQYEEDSSRYISFIRSSLSEQYYKSGFELFQKNRFEEAAGEYKKSLQYNHENASAKVELERLSDVVARSYYEKGMSYYKNGNIEKAAEMFKKSLSFKPGKEESLRALERIDKNGNQ